MLEHCHCAMMRCWFCYGVPLGSVLPSCVFLIEETKGMWMSVCVPICVWKEEGSVEENNPPKQPQAVDR